MSYLDTIQANNTRLQGLITRVKALDVSSGGSGEGVPLTIEVHGVSDAIVTATKGDLEVIAIAYDTNSVTITVPEAGVWTIRASRSDGSVSTVATVNVVSEYSASVAFKAIYGVKWDGSTSSKLTRTDNAADFADPVPYVAGATTYGSPFDSVLPWSGIEVVEDDAAGTLVKIPKFYFKWTVVDSSLQLQISPVPEDGFMVSPAHSDRGDGVGERDYVYVGRYMCCSTDYKSTRDVKPKQSAAIATMASKVHALDDTVWMTDYYMLTTIRMLYLVEFADWDVQSTIGNGGGDDGAVTAMGYTDSMPYHTGTMLSSRTTYGHGCQYRYIEGLWENIHEYIGGTYHGSSGSAFNYLYVVKTPSTSFSGGKSVGSTPSTTGAISVFGVPTASGYEGLAYPKAVSGTDYTLYTCDRYYYYASSTYIYEYLVGYYKNANGLPGLFSTARCTGSASSYIGGRLMKLP